MQKPSFKTSADHTHQIDFEAVGAVYGLTRNQVYQRYWRLSKYCEGCSANAKQDSSKTDGGVSALADGKKGKRKVKTADAGGGGKGKKRKLTKPDNDSDDAEEDNVDIKGEDELKVKNELEE